jgi:hypothetical protein
MKYAVGIPPERISSRTPLAAATGVIAAFSADQVDHALATFLLKILQPAFLHPRPPRPGPASRKDQENRDIPPASQASPA